jgi:hypothetical protein
MFQPQISAEDGAALQHLARQTRVAHRLVQRAKLALLLAADPSIASTVAARQLGQHPNWVRDWRKRWTREGFSLAGLADMPRSGRPPVFSPSGGSDCDGHRL